MKFDIKRLLLSIFFFIFAALALFCLIKLEFRSYYLIAFVISLVVALGFLKQSKRY